MSVSGPIIVLTLFTAAPGGRDEPHRRAPARTEPVARPASTVRGTGTPTARSRKTSPPDGIHRSRPAAARARAAGAPDLAALARKALSVHPSVQQIEARIRVARAKAGQVSAYPDPKLSVGLLNMPFWPARFDETPMTGLQITLTQVIPWPTKLSLAGKVARRRAEVAAAALAEARIRLAAAIRIGWMELALRDAERRIETERDDLLERLLKVVLSRYRVNKAQLQDLLKARLERSQVADRLQRIARARDAAEARLNALLGRSAGARLPGEVAPPRSRPLKGSLAQWIRKARRHRPALARWKERMAVQSLRRKQARTGYYPDLGVSLGYRYRQDSGMDPVEGMDFWSVGVSVRIPLWSIGKTRAAVKEADAALSRERAGYQNELLQVARQVRTAHDAIGRLQRRRRLYEKRILPEAKQTLEAAIQSYTTGKLDFLSVLDHERALYRHQLGALRVRVRLAQQWAALRAAVGEAPARINGKRP